MELTRIVEEGGLNLILTMRKQPCLIINQASQFGVNQIH